MYKFFISIVLSGIVLSACENSNSIEVANTLDQERTDEPIVISRAEFSAHFNSPDPSFVPVLRDEEKVIPIQLDDLDGDQLWDELAFVLNLPARGKKSLTVSWVAADEQPDYANRTQVYLGTKVGDDAYAEVLKATAPVGLEGFPTKFQAEGVGWENDKMAFRVYFDTRNVKDLFGKLEPGLILHKVGTSAMGPYHELAPWGMDVLHCGSSLGAGGLAMLENDSLYRLGSTASYTYQQLADGPVRSIFELQYEGWEVGNEELEATERITLWAGKYWFQSEVTAKNFTGKRKLVTGIVTTKLKENPIEFKANLDYTVLLAHGKQSLNNDVLAMAVMTPTIDSPEAGASSNLNFYLLGNRTVPSKNFSHAISETAYQTQNIQSTKPAIHYFFALWALEDAKWNDPDAVQNHIIREANKLSNPIQITY